MADTESLLSILRSFEWHVVLRPSASFLPIEVRRRYPRLPENVESFLSSIEVCTNKDETVWFLTQRDYGANRDGMFRWNEHELMCLDAAGGDNEEEERVRAFWSRHFPFMFAVHSDYDYLAVDLSPEAYGQIVHGYMPEPEQTSLVARSFSEFVLMFTETFRGKANYPLTLFK